MNHDADRPDGPTPPRGAVGGPPAPPDLGDWLRAAREEAGLDLATVAGHTHVRATYLEALEREDLAALPEDVYARNFLRLYARALGLDESDALQRFSRLRRLR
ncbi:MAG: helix-turn-helix domain-containing protein, partial [Trueperaceae bacterium]|nr:helix-turn-helix domain-containing protein [Trueperaceae bacterium]